MASGNRSPGGTDIVVGLGPVAGSVGMALVMSLAGAAAACGGTSSRALSSVLGPEELFDCFSTGVGEIIEGGAADGAAGLAAFSAGTCTGAAAGSAPAR